MDVVDFPVDLCRFLRGGRVVGWKSGWSVGSSHSLTFLTSVDPLGLFLSKSQNDRSFRSTIPTMNSPCSAEAGRKLWSTAGLFSSGPSWVVFRTTGLLLSWSLFWKAAQ